MHMWRGKFNKRRGAYSSKYGSSSIFPMPLSSLHLSFWNAILGFSSYVTSISYYHNTRKTETHCWFVTMIIGRYRWVCQAILKLWRTAFDNFACYCGKTSFCRLGAGNGRSRKLQFLEKSDFIVADRSRAFTHHYYVAVGPRRCVLTLHMFFSSSLFSCADPLGLPWNLYCLSCS